MSTYIKTLKDLLGNLILPRTSAAAVAYDNTGSGLAAGTAQTAIDELADGKEPADTAIMKTDEAQVMTADLTAHDPALADAKVRNIKISTTDLTAGSSELAEGQIYCYYEV